jgi:tRNA dimethylallyltransferase
VITDKKPLVVLLGPTAVGKSRVGIEVAKRLGSEVLTADSRQVYRGMDIGMDKPTLLERQGVAHRLIDLVEPDQPFNVGLFRRAAAAEIDRLYRSGMLPLLVGGTGLYIRALIRGLWDGPSADWTLRKALMQRARERGAEALHLELAEVDPDTAARLHPHDAVKIVRALEVYAVSGEPLSAAHRRHGFGESPYRPLLVGLTMERAALYRRIDARVEAQLAKGLLEETRRLLDRGYSRSLGSMKGLGYRQMAGYLSGDYPFEEAVRRLTRDTRHFAKRQMTWFRKEPEILWLQVEETEAVETVAERVLDTVARYLRRLEMESERPASAVRN